LITSNWKSVLTVDVNKTVLFHFLLLHEISSLNATMHNSKTNTLCKQCDISDRPTTKVILCWCWDMQPRGSDTRVFVHLLISKDIDSLWL